MSIFLWIVVIIIALFIFSSLSHKTKDQEAEEKNKEESSRRRVEKNIINPENKLHEEEKKRWENDYWERKEKK